MADTESILQLGIEAARAGDKEEARNLFRLLTRETPDDAQAWLWLAGVAEDREEKRAALEQVVRLDSSNDLARQGLAALGGPSTSSRPAPAPPPPSPESTVVFDDLDTDFDDFNLEASRPMTPSLDSTPPEPSRRASDRELSPDEEFAMSLDSLGSMSTGYQDRMARGNDPNDMVNFDIPDFGEDEFDVEAYMNRDRVDASQIELTEEDMAVRPSRHARASGGSLTPILLIAAAVAVAALIWFLSFRSGPETAITAADQTATAAAVAAGGGTVSTATPLGDLPTLEPGGTGIITDTNPPVIPTEPPPGGGEQPGGGETPSTPGQVGVPNPPAELVNAAPQLLAADGFTPVQVNGWFFNYGGVNTVIDGALGDLQPAGRWLVITPLMYNATGQDQPIPGDLVVLKDAQGRIYAPNADASVAVFNASPGAYNIQQYENAPQGFNFTMPLVFDVAPDATDLVLFSPFDTSQGYLVRNSVQ